MFENLISNEYLRALVVFVIFLFGLRLLLFVFQRITLKLASKTKTDIDDKIVEKSSWPLTAIAFLVALRITMREINFAENVAAATNNVIYSLIIIFIAYIIYVVVSLVIVSALKKFAKKTKSEIDDSLVTLFKSVLDVALIVITLMYILSIWGIQIGPLLATLGIAGLAVALALQPILSNIFSGASVILDRSVRVGDVVSVPSESLEGKIEKIGMRSSRILTYDNEHIVIPNNKLAEGVIQNIALPEPKTRIALPFGVAYGTDIDKVKKLVLKEVKRVKGICKDPAPHVKFLEMADSSLNFKVYFYVNTYEIRLTAKDQANTLIYNALNKAKIEIPFPQMDVHLRKD